MRRLAAVKCGCRKTVRVYPTECGQQLGRDPLKNGGTILRLWDAPVLCPPPLPLSQEGIWENQPGIQNAPGVCLEDL